MKKTWLAFCRQLGHEQADFYSGARKILRNRTLVWSELKDDLTIADSGYTRTKMTLLTKAYLHEESRDMAVQLWDRRIGQAKYGSVGFSCYNHLLKADPDKKSKRASVMGPCIQAVTLTLLNKNEATVDIFYRTTEFYKKFPADLVFIRDVLLPPFDFESVELRDVAFHFANITMHPMYYVTVIPLQKDPIKELRALKRRDKFFHDWIVKWTARYLVPEYHRGIEKFAQALRVHKDATERIPGDMQRELCKYLIANHPGYRNDAV